VQDQEGQHGQDARAESVKPVGEPGDADQDAPRINDGDSVGHGAEAGIGRLVGFVGEPLQVIGRRMAMSFVAARKGERHEKKCDDLGREPHPRRFPPVPLTPARIAMKRMKRAIKDWILSIQPRLVPKDVQKRRPEEFEVPRDSQEN